MCIRDSANDAWVARATVVDVQATIQGGALSAEELRLHFTDLVFIDPVLTWRAAGGGALTPADVG